MSYTKAKNSEVDETKGNTRYIHWESLQGMVECARADQFCAANPEHHISNESMFNAWINEDESQSKPQFYVGPHWYKQGIRFADILKMNTHPNLNEYMNEMHKFETKNLEGFVAKKKRRRKRIREEGESVSIDHYVDDPNLCMTEIYTDRVASNICGFIDLVSEVGGNSNMSSEQLENSGLAASALADALEDIGYRVRIIMAHKVTEQDPRAAHNVNIYTCIIKHYNEPLDMGRVGFTIGTGGFYRTVMFSTYAKCALERVARSLGAAVEIKESDLKKLPVDISENSVMLPRMRSREEAERFVKKTIEEKRKEAEAA